MEIASFSRAVLIEGCNLFAAPGNRERIERNPESAQRGQPGMVEPPRFTVL